MFSPTTLETLALSLLDTAIRKEDSPGISKALRNCQALGIPQEVIDHTSQRARFRREADKLRRLERARGDRSDMRGGRW